MLLFNAETICKAAEYSMLFQPSGEVLPCHYNRGYILGKYPDNSIREIWHGKKREELIKSIKRNFYHHGCFQCKTDSENGLTHSVGKNKYLYVKTNNKNFPSLMEFQLDNICNLECIMCSGEYSSKIRQNIEKGDKYISPYDDRFVEQLEPFIPFLEQAVFTGGEPFLFPIYYKIWDLIGKIKPELQIFVSTNGTVLNDKVKHYLNKLNFNFTISIDSINEETYCKIRRNAKLDDTLNNIDFFIKYSNDRNASLNIKCLVLPQNYTDIPDMIEYFNKQQINVLPKLAHLPLYTSMSSLANDDLNKVIKVLSSTGFTPDSATTVHNR
ncbi:MAG TPA: radical SAM protein, partial [Bacteroidales bacterium]|nr:radical SAM protein [Bacteroidales bacterium]